jgi:hypothetical protein
MIKKPEYFILCVTPLILLIGLIYVIMAFFDLGSDDEKLFSFIKNVCFKLGMFK